jgi:Leucine-rich repeat (LRR) protein
MALTHLDVSGNYLASEFTALSALTALVYLDASYNTIRRSGSGTFCVSLHPLAVLTALRSLNMADKRIDTANLSRSQPRPACHVWVGLGALTACQQLHTLNLAGSNLHFPEGGGQELGSLTMLQHLDMQWCTRTYQNTLDRVPWLTCLAALTHLALVTDSYLPGFAQAFRTVSHATTLQCLHLRDAVTGDFEPNLLRPLSALTALTRLSMRGPKLTSGHVTELARIWSLQHLSIVNKEHKIHASSLAALSACLPDLRHLEISFRDLPAAGTQVILGMCGGPPTRLLLESWTLDGRFSLVRQQSVEREAVQLLCDAGIDAALLPQDHELGF